MRKTPESRPGLKADNILFVLFGLAKMFGSGAGEGQGTGGD